MAQLGFGPASLSVGTEVSAKYRGAFCEAKVKIVTRVVKCKVMMKDSQSSIFVTDDEIKGNIKLGSVVEVKHPDTGQPVEATINKLIDQSSYTVVFDDGDERTLRRTQLCLKGDKHFIESETLDNLPLSHPEHFGTPVLKNKTAKRKSDPVPPREESDDEESPRRAKYRGRHQELVGKLMVVDQQFRKGSVIPAVVVLPDANSISEVKNRDQILVRSFKDSKFSVVTRRDLKEFSRSVAIKNDDKTMRTAFERALLYHDTKELPVGWKKTELLGSDVEEDDGEGDVDEYASEDEPFEEKDRFVAQLYKFMDDRGTPINKGPSIGNKDLNLYKLFKIVQNLGGYNKVTKEMKWPVVYSKMGLPSLHVNPSHQIKTAYKKYLDAYETFYRKLGSTMGTHSRPGRARENSGRSILNFRGRGLEKSPRSPKPPETKAKDVKDLPSSPKPKVETMSEKLDDSQDAGSVASTEEKDSLGRRMTPRRDARTLVVKEDQKDKKDEEAVKIKKEESPKVKKEEPTKVKKEEPPKIKEDTPRSRKDEPTKISKKEEANASRRKKDPSPSPKSKKEDVVKVKKEEEVSKKEERKSARKVQKEEEKDVEQEKDEKKPVRSARKEKEEIKKEEEKKEEPIPEVQTVISETPKKRVTRRKLIHSDNRKETDSKEEEVEDKKDVDGKKENVIKSAPVDAKVAEKKDKELPRTLERRDSRSLERKESLTKTSEKKEVKSTEKKTKIEEKKVIQTEDKMVEGDNVENVPEIEKEKSEEVEQDQESTKQELVSKRDFPIGSKLKVKYGKGKHLKIYQAKVIDYGRDGTHKTFLVHYAGWNNRYNEWIRADRVVAVLDKPDVSNKVMPTSTKSLKTFSSVMKKMNQTKTSTIVKKPGSIFRTPILSSKARSTRSKSSDISVLSGKKPGKTTVTRRRSILTDSDSKSSGSHKGSDTEETTESEQADDDVNTKDVEDEDYDESEMLEVEIDDEIDITKDESSNTSLDDGENLGEECAASESAEDDSESLSCQEQVNVTAEVEKSATTLSEPTLNETPETYQLKDSEEEEKTEYVEILQSEEKEWNLEILKSGKRAVTVITFKSDDDDILLKEVDDSVESMEIEVKIAPKDEDSSDLSDDLEDGDSPKLEIVEEDEIQKEVICDNISAPEEPLVKAEEPSSPPPPAIDHTIPQLKKIDLELEKKEKESERGRMWKGRRKDMNKDVKKLAKSEISPGASEIPTLEPIVDTVSVPSKADPSPYDFDAEVDAPWQPEITKKWEPSQKTPFVSKDSGSISDDGLEKEKKKVKKKAKKKPISPEFVDEGKAEEKMSSACALSVCGTPTTHKGEKTSASHVNDTISDKTSMKKKGRKKRDLSLEPKKEVIDDYENTVNSVVEAVKHSLQESEEDIKPIQKKRRRKLVSESDKKDMSWTPKLGKRFASKDTSDIDTSGNLECEKENFSDIIPVNSTAVLSASRSEDSADRPCTSGETSQSVFGKDKVVSSLSDSIGFDPTLGDIQDTPFENTPPTTPEHDEQEVCGNAAMHQKDSSYSASHLSSCKSDGSKHICPSATSSSSSLSLPASSSNIAQSKCASESPSDNDVISTASTDNLDNAMTAQHSESSGTEQEAPTTKKRKRPEEDASSELSASKKKKRIHGTRSRTAKKSPKYIGNDSPAYTNTVTVYNKNSDSQGSSSTTPNHCPESPPSKFTDLTKSPRPAKFSFNADLGEYLEGEARCNFLITKMQEIKTIYMNLKSEVASIDRRRKRMRRKERDSTHISSIERENST